MVGLLPADAQANGSYWNGAPSTRVNWSGLYVGVHAGYGWSDVDQEITDPAIVVGAPRLSFKLGREEAAPLK
jgi:hypothetical protein